MEDIVHVRVFLPVNRCEYEVDIPTGLNTHVAALLTAQALQARANGFFIASTTSYFAKASTGEMLDREKTIKNNGIHSGDFLMLI